MAHDPGRQVDETAISMLEALFTQSPIGLHLLDTDLRVVRVNTATPSCVAVPRTSCRDARSAMSTTSSKAAPWRHSCARCWTAEPLFCSASSGRVSRDPPQERHFEISALRLQSPRGSVLGVAVTAIDVTARERARTRSEVLDSVRRYVGRTLDPAVTGEELVPTVVPAFADIAIVEVVEAVIRGDDPPQAPLPTGTPLMRTAFRSNRARPPQAHPVGDVRRLPAPTPFTQALTDLRPRVVALRPTAPWLSVDPPRAEAIHSSGAHSLLVVPLALRDAALGVVSLYRSGNSPPFDEGDRELAAELATHGVVHRQRAALHPGAHGRRHGPAPAAAPPPGDPPVAGDRLPLRHRRRSGRLVRHHRPVRRPYRPRRRQGVGARSERGRDHGAAAHRRTLPVGVRPRPRRTPRPSAPHGGTTRRRTVASPVRRSTAPRGAHRRLRVRGTRPTYRHVHDGGRRPPGSPRRAPRPHGHRPRRTCRAAAGHDGGRALRRRRRRGAGRQRPGVHE